jgi:hypothetical protein
MAIFLKQWQGQQRDAGKNNTKYYNVIILITLNPPVPPLQYPHATATQRERGDDGNAMGGGGAEGAARFDIFRKKNAGVFRWCAIRLAQQATISRRMADWRKGMGCTFRPAKPSPYKIEG